METTNLTREDIQLRSDFPLEEGWAAGILMETYEAAYRRFEETYPLQWSNEVQCAYRSGGGRHYFASDVDPQKRLRVLEELSV